MNDKKLWTVFSEFIRLRDSNDQGFCQCITCPRIKYYKEMDCGHGIGRQHKATKFDEKNNNAQCKPCNGFEGGKREQYKVAINKKFGPQTWELLEIKSKSVYKWSQFEVDQLTIYYRKEVEKLKVKKQLRA